MAQDQGAGREGGRVERLTRTRGLELPGLKQWRIRRDLTQQELAQRVVVPLQYISRVEQGKRGCNQALAQKIAEVLEVDLRELLAAPGLQAGPALRNLDLHEAYLKMLLDR
jgi:transcriptional regulator with XRE-family HTH domain